jgi:hypothetical protein
VSGIAAVLLFLWCFGEWFPPPTGSSLH